ncbi:hypothetical protein MTR_1g114580 [Medicago truncatula]|uniref:Uncharacterized protein n=1 Tax=Medicago truncatula TaxID=3880 RepID=A0A072W2F6_MEDTR|nr:hypothetical protein MTR_1g114580 [Medicago truncatula]
MDLITNYFFIVHHSEQYKLAAPPIHRILVKLKSLSKFSSSYTFLEEFSERHFFHL